MDGLNKLFQPLDGLSHLAHWGIRFALAGIFIYHGFGKLAGGVGGFAAEMGLPLVIAYLVALGELAAGILVLAGVGLGSWATRAAGGIIFIIMLGAIFMVHLPNGWDFGNGGAEFQTLTALVGLFLLLRGNNIGHKVHTRT